MEYVKDYDVVVIGGGPGGYTAAIASAQNGFKTALIERNALGGACLNVGCMPTKTLLDSSKAFYDAKNSFSDIGVIANDLSYDIEKIFENKDSIVQKLVKGIESLMKSNKIDVYNGIGRIEDKNSISISIKDTDEKIYISSRNILIATGAKPIKPSIDGINENGVMTSDDMLSYNKPINSITIIGGGVIGVEFASIYSYLGVDVTILEGTEKILPPLDKEISQNLSMILKKRGVNIKTSAMVTKITKNNDGIECFYEFKDENHSCISDVVLVCVGRKANIDNIFNDNMEIDIEKGVIKVDDNFRTSIDNIYAIGDVTGGMQLAHAASAHAEHVVAIIANKISNINLEAIPSCVYTNPEIATVGLTADEAKEKGIDVKVGKSLMSANGRSVIDRQDRGFIKIVVDAKTDKIIGAHLMCGRASDIIGELSLAVANGLTYDSILKTIHPHPTFVESVFEAAKNIK